MSKVGHTSAPWAIDNGMLGDSLYISKRGFDGEQRIIAFVSTKRDETSRPDADTYISKKIAIPTAQADARLICAAPDLLAAAKQAEELIRNGGVVPIKGEAWAALTAAIAKAEGR